MRPSLHYRHSPPNVTASLHIGHALDNTLQDILIRHARLQGKDALWVVAWIMRASRPRWSWSGPSRQGLTREGLGREKFLDIVWDWKATSGGAITRQLRRLGASCDWANERFTMDPGFSAAVIKVFVQLYREGLLYRDKRLVNWDPRFGTAISDLEVETREVQGHFWHLIYPWEGGGAIHVDHPARDDARRHGGRGHPGINATRVSERGCGCDHRAPCARPSPMSMPIRSSARVPSRSLPVTTSTIRSRQTRRIQALACSTC